MSRHREAASCRGCGAERHSFRGECESCDAPVCSECCVEENNQTGLCRRCAIKRLNQQLAPLVPICICSELVNDSVLTFPKGGFCNESTNQSIPKSA